MELWLTVAKYFLLIVNGIACGLAALFATTVAIVGLAELFTGHFGAFFDLLILTAVVSLITLYFYLVPIQGVTKGLSTRLIAHGIICGLCILAAICLLTTDGSHVSTGHPKMDQLVATYKGKAFVLSRLILDILQVIACLSMANFFQKRDEYEAPIWNT